MRASWLVVCLASCTVGEAIDPSDGSRVDSKAGEGLPSGDLDAAPTDDIGSLAMRVCATGSTVLGVDVSYYQGSINWSSVRAAGVGFAFIRVSDGIGKHDPKFASYWAGAKNAGLIRGAYQFFRPNQSVTAQADLMINSIGTLRPGDLAPVIDVEVTGGLGASTVAADVRQWVDRVRAATGVAPIVYTGKYFWRDQVGGSTAEAANPLWIAQYTSQCPDLPSPWTTWKFWQYSDTGHVAGISGGVDVDRFNGSMADLRALARL
jgi:lysozyme